MQQEHNSSVLDNRVTHLESRTSKINSVLNKSANAAEDGGGLGDLTRRKKLSR